MEDAAGAATFTPDAPIADSGHLTVKVQVDSYTEIKLRGAELWIDHTKCSGALPGRSSGELSTTVDR
ncbi:MAG: hypothetical protein AAF585_22010, partial [Verrucomicrobiota bacterium]